MGYVEVGRGQPEGRLPPRNKKHHLCQVCTLTVFPALLSWNHPPSNSSFLFKKALVRVTFLNGDGQKV